MRGVQGATDQLVTQMTLESIDTEMLPPNKLKKLMLMDRLERTFKTIYTDMFNNDDEEAI